jgi:protein subunit release factor B
MTSRSKIREVLERMRRLGIRREDLRESFIRGGGAGGQKINKTSSTVVLRHLPTTLEVRCQRERSLSQNRFLARVELCDKIESLRQRRKQARAAETARHRAQTRKPSRAEKARMINKKRLRGRTKRLRGKPGMEE